MGTALINPPTWDKDKLLHMSPVDFPIYVWVKYDGAGEWEPYMSFADYDENAATSIMTDAQAEIQDLRDQGCQAKRGKPFPR